MLLKSPFCSLRGPTWEQRWDKDSAFRRSPDSSSCSSRDPSPCARAPGSISHAPIARRQSTTDEIFIARGFRRQSTIEETIKCRNFRRQSSQSEKLVISFSRNGLDEFGRCCRFHSIVFLLSGSTIPGTKREFDSNHRRNVRHDVCRDVEHLFRQQHPDW